MENNISHKTEDTTFITKPSDFVPRLTYLFALDWYSFDEIEYYDESGRSSGKFMEDKCEITLTMLRKAIARRGFGAHILFDHSSNNNSENAWHERKQYNPVYKIDNDYYVFAYEDHTGELVFQELDQWLLNPSL